MREMPLPDVVEDVLEDMTTTSAERLAQPAPIHPIEANGAIVAALLSAGLACALLGVATVVTEAHEPIKQLMTLSEPVGPLSGKTTVPTLAWLMLWPLLHLRLRTRDLDLRRATQLTLALVALGLLGTFPPFYQHFATGA
jgi:hypothetical protein